MNAIGPTDDKSMLVQVMARSRQPLPEQMMIQTYVTIWGHKAPMC